jgi:hypothetical protein
MSKRDAVRITCGEHVRVFSLRFVPGPLYGLVSEILTWWVAITVVLSRRRVEARAERAELAELWRRRP